MRVLVFGQSGQVATELQAIDGLDLRAVARSEADLSQPAQCAEIIAAATGDIDAVINAAAYTAVDKAEAEPELAHLVNGTAPGVMAQACAQAGVPFVNISTDYVFDGSGTRAFAPSDPTGPLGVYGASKRLGEENVSASGARAVSLRTSWVFSAHGANFVKTMLRLSADRDVLTIVADQIGGPTPARAIAQACVQIARALRDETRDFQPVYHFSGQPEASWSELAREIFTVSGRDVHVKDIPTSEFPTPAARPANSRLDCSDTERDFDLRMPDWKGELRAVLRALGEIE